jgi:hypothetical protein
MAKGGSGVAARDRDAIVSRGGLADQRPHPIAGNDAAAIHGVAGAER